MASLVLRNVQYLQGEEFSLQRGDIAIEEGRISRLYPPGEAPPGEQELGDEETLVIPGFVNAHLHLLDGGAKEKWIGQTIPELFGPQGYKAKMIDSTPEKELAREVRRAWKGLLQQGVTTAVVFAEKGEKGLELLAGNRPPQAPRAVLLGRPLRREGPEFKEEIHSLLDKGHGLAPGSLNGLDDEALALMSELAQKGGKICATHMAEVASSKNLDRGLEHYRPDFLVHGNYFEQAELEKLARHKVGLVCCIRSGSSFGLTTPDLGLLDRLGIPFALATDNLMSNSPNLFREMEFATRLLMHRHRGKLTVLPEKILRAVTFGAARLVGLNNTGVIKEGFRADLLLLRQDLQFQPFQGVLTLIFRAGVGNIEWTILAGKPLQRSKL